MILVGVINNLMPNFFALYMGCRVSTAAISVIFMAALNWSCVSYVLFSLDASCMGRILLIKILLSNAIRCKQGMRLMPIHISKRVGPWRVAVLPLVAGSG